MTACAFLASDIKFEPERIPMPLSRSLTSKERSALRKKIAVFCRRPRTYKEVAEHFNISGTSASAFLTRMSSDVLAYDYALKTYKKVSERERRRRQRHLDGLTEKTIPNYSFSATRAGKMEQEALNLRAEALKRIR